MNDNTFQFSKNDEYISLKGMNKYNNQSTKNLYRIKDETIKISSENQKKIKNDFLILTEEFPKMGFDIEKQPNRKLTFGNKKEFEEFPASNKRNIDSYYNLFAKKNLHADKKLKITNIPKNIGIPPKDHSICFNIKKERSEKFNFKQLNNNQSRSKNQDSIHHLDSTRQFINYNSKSFSRDKKKISIIIPKIEKKLNSKRMSSNTNKNHDNIKDNKSFYDKIHNYYLNSSEFDKFVVINKNILEKNPNSSQLSTPRKSFEEVNYDIIQGENSLNLDNFYKFEKIKESDIKDNSIRSKSINLYDLHFRNVPEKISSERPNITNNISINLNISNPNELTFNLGHPEFNQESKLNSNEKYMFNNYSNIDDIYIDNHYHLKNVMKNYKENNLIDTDEEKMKNLKQNSDKCMINQEKKRFLKEVDFYLINNSPNLIKNKKKSEQINNGNFQLKIKSDLINNKSKESSNKREEYYDNYFRCDNNQNYNHNCNLNNYENSIKIKTHNLQFQEAINKFEKQSLPNKEILLDNFYKNILDEFSETQMNSENHLPVDLNNLGDITVSKKIKNIKFISKVGFSGVSLKSQNQDNFSIIENFSNEKENYFIAVFDGHGEFGHKVSEFIKNNLPDEIVYSMLSNDIDFPSKDFTEAIKEGFERTSNRLIRNKEFDIYSSGSTCASLFLNGNKIISANLGDSHAIMGKIIDSSDGSKIWEYMHLTRDHKPDEEDEKQRILKNGGKIEPLKNKGEYFGPPRVWIKHKNYPGLAMTRSFGDRIASSIGIICEPEIFSFELTYNDKFFIIASDGLWDFIDYEECVHIVKEFYIINDSEACCQYLFKEASKRWLKEVGIIDDITIIVAFFD